jgi:RNA polymerase sigma-70 factor (ECF subfamily)
VSADIDRDQHRRPDDCPASGFRLRSSSHETDEVRRATRRAVARAKQGDRGALHYLYAQYADNVYSYVTTIVRNHHEAEDVTQQVFAKLFDGLGRYEDRGAPFLSWLLRLARNAAIDQLRARRAVPLPESLEHAEEMATPDSDRLEVLRGALDSLPDDQREIIVLRHVAGLAPHEIAARMRRSESSVHGLHHRGRRALRAELVRQGAAPVTLAA